MMKLVHPTGARKPTVYHRFLLLLCWLKVIPLSGRDRRFCLFSLTTLLSTIWGGVPCAYNIFYMNYEQTGAINSNSSEGSGKNKTDNASINLSLHDTLSQAIFNVFLLLLFLLMLLLPTVLGHFFAINQSAMLWTTFTWPHRGWMLVVSTIIFIVSSAISLSLTTERLSALISTERLVYFYIGPQLCNLIAALLQLISVILVSARQTAFLDKAVATSKDITVDTIQSLLKEYENISNGVGPFYVLEFCVHVMNTLCFTYFGLANISVDLNISSPLIVMSWSWGNVTWSCLILIHICLMSDDCYEALQCLVQSIRYLS
jgi:hypothetical protein